MNTNKKPSVSRAACCVNNRQNQSIDLALDVARVHMRPGDWLSTRAIAEICGCSNTLIYLIEKKALRRVRERLRRHWKMSWGEFLEIDLFRQERKERL